MKYKVFIDIGHGAHDSGAYNKDYKLKEKDINLATGLLLKDYLSKYENIDLRLSRYDDTFLPINKRYQMANEWKADIFISIHTNAGGGVGAETLYYHPQSKELAEKIQSNYIKEMKITDRGIRFRNNLGVIRWTNMPSCLIELGFIDNEIDIPMLINDREKMAKGLLSGVLDYLKIPIKGGDNLTEERVREIIKEEINKDKKPDRGHWANSSFDYLNNNGITIHEKRFDDNITRGEMLSLLERAIKLNK